MALLFAYAASHRGFDAGPFRWKMAIVAILACVFVVATRSPGAAQLSKGKVEAGLLLGGGTRLSDDKDERYMLLRTLGFVLSDATEVGLALGLVGDVHKSPSTAVLLQGHYHLARDATITPYLGMHVGLEADVLSARPRLREALGPQIGAKWRCGEKLLLIAELRGSMPVASLERSILFVAVGFSFIESPSEAPAEPSFGSAEHPPSE